MSSLVDQSIDIVHAGGATATLLVLGGVALWRTVIYINGRVDQMVKALEDKVMQNLTSLEAKMDERNSNLHSKIDGKCDNLNSRINTVEKNGRDDTDKQTKRIDDLIFELME